MQDIALLTRGEGRRNYENAHSPPSILMYEVEVLFL